MFQHPVHEDVIHQDFQEYPGSLDYDVLQGASHSGQRLAVHTGLYGASDPHDFEEPDDVARVESLHVLDPLQTCKVLSRVREYFLQNIQPDWTEYEVHPHTPKSHRNFHLVERYLHVKYVNRQLLICGRDFRVSSGVYNWSAFSVSAPNEGEDQGAYLRPVLAEAAQVLSL